MDLLTHTNIEEVVFNVDSGPVGLYFSSVNEHLLE